MTTLNMSLAGLFKRNVITLDEAFSRTTDPDNLQQILKTM